MLEKKHGEEDHKGIHFKFETSFRHQVVKTKVI
jgi:hypothetical protein